jgi:hypothetical protein
MAQLHASVLGPRIRTTHGAVRAGLAAIFRLLLAGGAPPLSDRPLIRGVIQRADRARLAPVGVWALIPGSRELGSRAGCILAAGWAHLAIAAIRPSRTHRAIGAAGFSFGPDGRWPRSQLAPAGIASLAPVTAAISPAATISPAIAGPVIVTPAPVRPAIVGPAVIRPAGAIGPAVVGTGVVGTVGTGVVGTGVVGTGVVGTGVVGTGVVGTGVVGTGVVGTGAARASGAATGFRRLRRPAPAPWAGSGLPRLRPDRRVTVSRCQGFGPDGPELA